MPVQFDATFEDIFNSIPSEFSIDELMEIYVKANEFGAKIVSAIDASTDFRRTYDSYWDYICNAIVVYYAMIAYIGMSDGEPELVRADGFVDDFMCWYMDHQEELQLHQDNVQQLLTGAGIDFHERRKRVAEGCKLNPVFL